MGKESTTPAWPMNIPEKVTILAKYLYFPSENKYWVKEKLTAEKFKVPATDQRSKYQFYNPVTKRE
jgi:hypothetical protein